MNLTPEKRNLIAQGDGQPGQHAWHVDHGGRYGRRRHRRMRSACCSAYRSHPPPIPCCGKRPRTGNGSSLPCRQRAVKRKILDGQDDHIRYDKTELRPQRRSDRRQECLSDQWQAGRSHGDAGPHAGITIDLYDERLRRLTKAQWIGVLDFVKYTGAKLLISLSSCAAWGRSICARQRRSSASATTMA